MTGRATAGSRPCPLPPPARRVEGRVKVDFAVVGAGICGCSTARRLAELRPDDSVALIEAGRVGYGTSGRNAGFMLDHHSHGGMKHMEAARKNDRLFSAGTDWLRRLVQEHQIQCQWSDWGRVYVAAGAGAEAELKGVSDGFDSLGVPWRELDRDGIEAVTGSRYYRRGVRVDGSALVQPAAMMRGLAAALPANVALYEESPVLEIGAAGGFRLALPRRHGRGAPGRALHPLLHGGDGPAEAPRRAARELRQPDRAADRRAGGDAWRGRGIRAACPRTRTAARSA